MTRPIRNSTRVAPDWPRSAGLVDVVLNTILADVAGERAIMLQTVGGPGQVDRDGAHVCVVNFSHHRLTDGDAAGIGDAIAALGRRVVRGEGRRNKAGRIELVPIVKTDSL